VPKRYAQVEPRVEVKISLGTDSLSEARSKEAQVWDQQVARWEALMKGDTTEAEARYEAAQEIAKSHGLRFLPAEKVAELPADYLLRRVQMSMNAKGEIDDVKASGILGIAKKPKLTIDKALDVFWELSKPETKGKSPDQLRR
jgi:hypothetical protein